MRDGYVTVEKGMKKNMKSVVILGMCQWIWDVPLHDKKPTRNAIYSLRHTCDDVWRTCDGYVKVQKDKKKNM